MTNLQQFKQYGSISEEVVEIIEADQDMKAGFEKAYEKQRPHIKGLSPKKQFAIVLATISFATAAIREYQEDQRKFSESLKRGDHDS